MMTGDYGEVSVGTGVDAEALKALRCMTSKEIESLDRRLAEALVFYYDRDYGRALPIFREIAGLVETMDIMWWIGNCAVNLGDAGLAMAKFKKMLAAAPALYRVRLELAVLYFKGGRYEEAIREFETVKAQGPPDNVVANIDRYLDAMKDRTKRLAWNLRFSQGLMWDDNASVGPDSRELQVVGGMLTLSDDSGQVGDKAWVTNMSADVIYDFGGDRGFMWSTGLSLSDTAYQEYAKFNYFRADLSTGPFWAKGRDIVKSPLRYREQYYGNERLSRVVLFEPSYEHFFSRYFSVRGELSAGKEIYYSPNNASLDNNTYRYEVVPSLYLFDRSLILSGSLGYEEKNADLTRFSYDARCLGVSGYLRLPSGTEVFLGYRKSFRDYRGSPLLYSSRREDDQTGITAVISQNFLKYLFASLSVVMTENGSNAALYDYEKTTYTASAGARF